MTSLEQMNRWADLYGIPHWKNGETLDAFRGRLLAACRPAPRYCINETRVTWVRDTIRGRVKVTEWTFSYNDGTTETVRVQA